jgi:putative acetyltransferase
MIISHLEAQPSQEHYEAVHHLFTAYHKELNEDLCFQGFDVELAAPFEVYKPPHGVIILFHTPQEGFVGCVAVKPLKYPEVAELKRMYLKPEYRNRGLGYELLHKAILFAKYVGYERIVLDSLTKLKPALHIYRKFGFKETPPYYTNPLQEAVYLELDLTEFNV